MLYWRIEEEDYIKKAIEIYFKEENKKLKNAINELLRHLIPTFNKNTKY